MAANDTRTASLIAQLVEWLRRLAEKGVPLDEYGLFTQILKSNPRVRRRVAEALAAAGGPAAATLTREQYDALASTQFEAAVAALLAELGMSLDEAKQLFCVKLKWCARKRWLRGLAGRLLGKVPKKWRPAVQLAGALAPWIWDAINILITIAPTVQWTLFAAHLAAYLASGALDKLCGCKS
ncbi:MAG TPA: hypothetical protein VMH50_17540 [Thermoleophilia bacterium]|nr:hypothetical protein [Thermoleophilia bacterium]